MNAPRRAPTSETAAGTGHGRHRRAMWPFVSPRSRPGRSHRSLLEARLRVDRALWAAIMTACIHATGTGKDGHLDRVLGCDSGLSTRTVRRICAEIDSDVAALRARRSDHTELAEALFDARPPSRCASMAGPCRARWFSPSGLPPMATGRCCAAGVGDAEDEALPTALPGSLCKRGLAGVRRVINGTQEGLEGCGHSTGARRAAQDPRRMADRRPCLLRQGLYRATRQSQRRRPRQ